MQVWLMERGSSLLLSVKGFATNSSAHPQLPSKKSAHHPTSQMRKLRTREGQICLQLELENVAGQR